MKQAFLRPLFLLWLFFIIPANAAACDAPPALLTAEPPAILSALKQDARAYLAAMDDYAAGMEACYDGPLGPLDLTPLAQAADALVARLATARTQAEDDVRGNELSYEALLSSPLWADLEALRVAAAYASAWGELALAVRQLAAEDKKIALRRAQHSLTRLGFEFKHPVLVQRAMYGLATAQLEAGQLAEAKSTLRRLQDSLRRGGAADFKTAIDDFLARISAPDYRPPAALFVRVEKPAEEDGRLDGNADAAERALALARQALRETRPAAEIAALLQPAMTGTAASVQAALDLAARDQTIFEAMDYPPGPDLRVMSRAFEAQKYGQMIAVWPQLQFYYRLMPEAMKQRLDVQIGVARLNGGAPEKALAHLRAAHAGLRPGRQKLRIERLMMLAELSIEPAPDSAPDAARLALAAGFAKTPLAGAALDAPPPTADQLLTDLLTVRARIVMARHAAAQKQWNEADQWLIGIGADHPAYRLFAGMRVRLQAEAIKGRKAAGEGDESLHKSARGADVLYRLWRLADCPPGCPTGNPLAVHQAAIEIAFNGGLDSSAFGHAWGGFVDAGGDVLPLLPRALAFLVSMADSERLIALLQPADEGLAARVLAQWKVHLQAAQKNTEMAARYGWLANGLDDLQGRPKAVLLEQLIAFDLSRNRPDRALQHAENLAAAFPRRPNAWFMRAAALQANQRFVEAARALSALAQRTPADDPVGMGARIGMAALFIDLQRQTQACAMRMKIFSRAQAPANWQQALDAFPVLAAWGRATGHCRMAQSHGDIIGRAVLVTEMAHAGKDHGQTGLIGDGNHFLIAD